MLAADRAEARSARRGLHRADWLPRLATRHVLLALILVAYVCLAFGYARATPRWNNPDEPAHFNYVRHVAQTGQLPILAPGDWDAELLARLTTERFPNDDEIAGIRYEGHQPPLYYLLGAAVNRLSWDLLLERQVLALRALSILLGVVTVVAAFVVGREVAPNRPELALLGGATVAFVPMHTAISAAINNDSLANALAGVTLATLLVGWRRGFGVRGAVALGVLLGLVLLTKLTAYVYVPLGLATLFLRERRPGPPLGEVFSRAARLTLLAGGVALLIASWWFVRNVSVYGLADPLGLARHDAVVVGQPRWQALDLASLDFFYRVLFRSFWGMFGWMGVVLPDRVYLLYLGLTLLAILGLLLPWLRVASRAIGDLFKRRGDDAGRGPVALRAPWLIWTPILLVFAAVAYYNLTFIQPQGRYLFPALVPLAVVLATGWWRLAATARSVSRLGAVPSALLAAVLGWSFGEAHGALLTLGPWSGKILLATALLAGLAVLAAPRGWRAAAVVPLIGLTGLALGLLDYAVLVRFVAPTFAIR
ncbi:MAG: DUF2142 domain-containing protein [Chloroflexota bacterium]|nr:DUF2142 domain-containing protein [Chloroflexota bacterium]